MTISRMIVLGDSVPWGEGLAPQHKYATLVGAGLGLPVAPEFFAHSGAIVDPSGSLGSAVDGCATISSEIPLHAPSIRAQVRTVPNPQTADFVLLNGGINDVDIHRMFNPFIRNIDLSRWIKRYCHDGMKILLSEAAQRFTSPSARFVVTGYFPILSDKSDQSLIEDFLSIFGIGLPVHLDPDPILQRITQLALQFWKESEQALSTAVNESAAELSLVGRLFYVPGPLKEANAVFASDPWLFEPADGLNPADEVAAARGAACDRCYQDPLDFLQHEECRLGSVGHPNVKGAQAYAEAILAALS
jgi:lysophospholipase L1-like esterase